MYDDEGPLMSKRPENMNKTLDTGKGPIHEALETLDDEIAKLEELIERHCSKVNPVVGPDMQDDTPARADIDRDRPPNSDVRHSLERKISHVRQLQYRIGRITERVEL